MQITEQQDGNVVVVAIDGRMDAVTSVTADGRIMQVIGGGQPVVLDLSGLEYISSLGLRVLFKAAKQAKAAQQSLALAGLRPVVKEVFDISGFTGLFAIHPGRDDALISLR
jgi:anti-anti-sigma factor